MPKPSSRKAADGTISWRIQYRIDGKLTTATFATVKAAEEFAELVSVVGGAQAREVLESRRGGNVILTLREWTTKYLDAASGLLTGIEDGTREGYQREAERTFLPFLGHYPVNAITKQAVGKWVMWQEQQTVWRDRNKPVDQRARVSAKTVKNAHALLSAVMAAAVAEKLRDDNPAYKTRISKGTKREAVFLSPAELDTIVHFTPEKHRRLILFLAGTGCRWGEATAMTWGDLTLHGTPPTVRVTKAWKRGVRGSSVLKHPKSSKARRSISLFPDLIASIGTPGPANELIFHGQTGNRVQHAHFTERVWHKALAKAMDEDLCAAEGKTPLTRAPHIHDLRHTHASWLIARGIPLPYIQVRLGHESYNTTVNVYGHLQPDAHNQMAFAMADTMSAVQFLALPAPADDEPELEFAEIVTDDDTA